MNTRERAVEILQQAETSLRALVADAAAIGDYENVVRLASWARALADLVKAELGGSGQQIIHAKLGQAPIGGPKESSRRGSARGAARQRGSRKTYPRFFRQRDQLVKVGWSKREKKEYQHRVPLPVLTVLASALAKIGADGRVFSTDRIVPLKDSADNAIPTYQLYVCLALLRQVELIDQHGRQGYSIPEVKGFEQAVENAWRQLPEH